MSVSLIPETAPFNAEQRAWLNGFFAGLLNVTDARGGDGAALAGVMPQLPSAPPLEEDFPWHDPALPLDERLALAQQKPAERQLMAAMAQLDCGACGYVCQTYAEAIARGEEKDLTRCSPGGNETARMLKKLVQLAPATATTVTLAPTSATVGAYGRNNPFAAKLKASRRLTHDDAPKDTRHVEIDLTGSQLTYRPGDALGILPENAPELVDGIIAALGNVPDELVPGDDGNLRPLHEAVRTQCALTRPRSQLLEVLATSATNSDEAQFLKKLLADGADDFLATMDVLDVLIRFPSARPTPSAFVGALGKLQPRLYSISSAIEKHPGEVHLTVGVVRYEAQGKWFHGVASNFLGVRSLPGDPVRVFIQPAHRFQLPADPSTPIIMVGPGTGIAPFRSFLEYREATSAPGKNWLLFGNQYRNFDYLYADELEAWQRSGLLTNLDLAFSRDTAQKIYVQDRLLERGAEVWRWLQEGAYFYVCGDAKKMAPDVDLALQQVVAEHGHVSADQAKQWVQQLAKDKRYLKDVY
jgi:sulfite reductase (NADPH) flavoprotein alpha-component